MASWASRFLVPEVYRDVLKYKLVEEVDADSLSYDLPLSDQSHHVLSLAYLLGCIFIGTLAICAGNGCFCFSGGIILLFIGAVSIYSYIIIRRIPSRLFDVSKKIKLAHAILKRREQVTFGLGLSPSYGQRKLRLKVFQIFRSLAKFFSSTADKFARAKGEQERILANFYSREIIQLLEKNVDETATLIDDGGLSTLVNLSALHISELCRLYLIYCSTLSNSNLIHFVKLSYSIDSKLKEFLGALTEIEAVPSVNIFIEKENTVVKVESHEAVALALNAISSSVLSQKISPQVTKNHIQKVLAMQWFKAETNDIPRENDEEAVILPEKSSTTALPLPENGPVVDQVFEALADQNQPISMCYEDDLSPETSVLAASLMEELKTALGGRSKEFENRERKALANFYGISEEELLKQEAVKKKEKEETSEYLGEAVGEPEEWQPQRKPVLTSELLQALAKRGPVQEAILGDSTDSD